MYVLAKKVTRMLFFFLFKGNRPDWISGFRGIGLMHVLQRVMRVAFLLYPQLQSSRCYSYVNPTDNLSAYKYWKKHGYELVCPCPALEEEHVGNEDVVFESVSVLQYLDDNPIDGMHSNHLDFMHLMYSEILPRTEGGMNSDNSCERDDDFGAAKGSDSCSDCSHNLSLGTDLELSDWELEDFGAKSIPLDECWERHSEASVGGKCDGGDNLKDCSPKKKNIPCMRIVRKMSTAWK